MELLHLGENIIRLRKKEHMTQEELANYMGVSKSSVSKWETSATYPDIMFLPELANLFNVTLDELIGYEPQLNKNKSEESIIHCQMIWGMVIKMRPWRN